MEIIELSINNFRSIGKEPVTVKPFKKINILIGQNNSGKSNIIKALQKIKFNQDMQIKMDDLDYHNCNKSSIFTFTFHLRSENQKNDFGISDYEDDLFFTYSVVNHRIQAVDSSLLLLPAEKQLEAFSFKTHSHFTRMPSDGQLKGEMLKITALYFGEILNILPEVHLVPQFRQILPGEQYSLDGKNLIATLGEFQHPQLGHEVKKDKFLKIQELTRHLLHLPGANLEVPYTNDRILIENQGLRLPLESYGTGVHELIILATALNTFDNVIFCIEEPEIHLHPRLQREFLEFIKKDTTNRYILTTHSNAFLSMEEDVQVVHLWQESNITFGKCIETSLDALKILEDLGIKPSDILQANFVVWVEGPSDRIYINRWISLLDDNLKENIDYAIMFYGGKLLSHVCMERELLPPESLVQLLRINQRSAIIMDSDKDSSDSEINETKKRVIKECENNDVFCWITHGREIENYLPGHSVSSVYSELCSLDRSISMGLFDKLEDIIEKEFSEKWRSSYAYEKSKPDFARKIASFIKKEDIDNNIDLKNTIESLINRIKSSNIQKSNNH